MSVSQKASLRRSWTGRKMQIFACALVACAIAFAIYGPDHPKGITFSGPLTMLILAAIFWQVGFKIQLRADCRYDAARNPGGTRTAAAVRRDSFDDDPTASQSSGISFLPEPSEDVTHAYWAQQRDSRGF